MAQKRAFEKVFCCDCVYWQPPDLSGMREDLTPEAREKHIARTSGSCHYRAPRVTGSAHLFPETLRTTWCAEGKKA
jgi:hypothetical protein